MKNMIQNKKRPPADFENHRQGRFGLHNILNLMTLLERVAFLYKKERIPDGIRLFYTVLFVRTYDSSHIPHAATIRVVKVRKGRGEVFLLIQVIILGK